ncbi:MAG: DUF4256 domain-containing protein [Myxococcaceae bacterium]|nr:DUF4256 domain-containing protein [Myxococcaceae bacterium]
MKKASGKAQHEDLLGVLRARFERRAEWHRGLAWDAVRKRLQANAGALKALAEMERTGGEPDVIAWDKKTGELVFCDCAPESPAGRRSVCYDRAALDGRKENKPKTSALDLAAAIGIELLDEAGYRELQKLGPFDTKTSSWVKTPASVRALGGALFCDFRYGQVFTYHNGAESYYAARGFRGTLRV